MEELYKVIIRDFQTEPIIHYVYLKIHPLQGVDLHVIRLNIDKPIVFRINDYFTLFGLNNKILSMRFINNVLAINCTHYSPYYVITFFKINNNETFI
jgi:hypothetical protein